MSDIDVSQILSQMRALSSQAQGLPASPAEATPGVDFSELLKSSVNKVNEQQSSAKILAESFDRGEGNADLAQVMISLQKASLSFQAMTQVRNKLLSAYQEIMGMSV